MPQTLIPIRPGRQTARDHQDPDLASGSKGVWRSSMSPLLVPKHLQAVGSSPDSFNASPREEIMVPTLSPSPEPNTSFHVTLQHFVLCVVVGLQV